MVFIYVCFSMKEKVCMENTTLTHIMSKGREGGRLDYCLEQDPSMNIHVNSTFKGNSTGFVRTAHQAKSIKEN